MFIALVLAYKNGVLKQCMCSVVKAGRDYILSSVQ